LNRNSEGYSFVGNGSRLRQSLELIPKKRAVLGSTPGSLTLDVLYDRNYKKSLSVRLTYTPSQAGEYVSGRLAGIASLVSGRIAMIDNGLGFQLVPWQPLLNKRIGQHITGLQRDDGAIEWTLGRNRGLIPLPHQIDLTM
jgi:hypothetical protein